MAGAIEAASATVRATKELRNNTGFELHGLGMASPRYDGWCARNGIACLQGIGLRTVAAVSTPVTLTTVALTANPC
jgi:hypothetical protein